MDQYNENNNYFKWGLTIFFVLCAFFLVIFVFLNLNNIIGFIFNVLHILSPVIIGVVMAFIIFPMYISIYNFLNKHFNKDNKLYKAKTNTFDDKKIPLFKYISITICVIFYIIVLIGLVTMIIPQLYISITQFLKTANYSQTSESLKQYINNTEFLSPFKTQLIEKVDELGTIFNEFINQDISVLIQRIIEFTGSFISNIYFGVMNTASFMLNIFIGFIVMIYVMYKKDFILSQYKKLVFAIFSKETSIKIIEECKFICDIFNRFITGKLFDSFIIFIITMIFTTLIYKIKFNVLVSLIIGFTNIIPFFGPIVGAIIILILILFSEPSKLLIMAIYVLIVQQFDGNILGPKILGNATGVDNFYVLCSILIFGGLFGFVGMLLAVPLWAIITKLLNDYLKKQLKYKNLPENSVDYIDL